MKYWVDKCTNLSCSQINCKSCRIQQQKQFMQLILPHADPDNLV